MSNDHQLRLFWSEQRDLSFEHARSVTLDAGSSVTHIPGWLHDHRGLFELLTTAAQWEQRKRWMFTQMVEEPRLTAEYPALTAAPRQLQVIAEALSAHYAISYDSAWLNLYRDHRDSTSWHADRPAARCASATVPVLSLGATRRFVIRPRRGGANTSFVVEAGDLIVMRGRCQRDWLHAVPKEPHARGARISVNFGSRSTPTDAPSFSGMRLQVQ